MSRRPGDRSRGWLDPRIYGSAVSRLRLIRALSLPSGAAVAILGAVLILMKYIVVGLGLIVAGSLVLAIGRVLPSLLRLVIGSGSDEELPVLLAALIPYASSSRSLAQLMIELPRRLGLRFLSAEADRLRILLTTGLDERAALRSLADTTPSRGLRETLKELLGAEEMGTSRSRLAAALYRKAMESLRAAWTSYTKLAEAITEGLVSLIVSVGVFIPLLAVGSAVSMAPLMAVTLVAIPLSAAALALMRPRLGDLEGGTYVMLVSLASAIASSLLLLESRPFASALVLVPGAVIGEVAWARASRETRESLLRLREAAERARLGLSFAGLLTDIRLLGRKIADAMEYATSVAGIGRSSAALEAFSDVISDAVIMVRSLEAESLLLSALSAISPLLSVVAIKVIISYTYGSPLLLASPAALAEALRLSIALAPLAPLPPMVMLRGRRVSTLPSLMSLAGALTVLRFLRV